MNGAIAGTSDGKHANAEMEAKFAPRRKQIEDQQSEINRVSEELAKPEASPGKDKRSAIQQDLDDRQKKLERDKQDYQEDLKRARQDYMQQISPKFVRVLEKYALNHGYDVVLDVSNGGGPVLYSSPGCDITMEVIAAYDSR